MGVTKMIVLDNYVFQNVGYLKVSPYYVQQIEKCKHFMLKYLRNFAVRAKELNIVNYSLNMDCQEIILVKLRYKLLNGSYNVIVDMKALAR